MSVRDTIHKETTKLEDYVRQRAPSNELLSEYLRELSEEEKPHGGRNRHMMMM